MADEHEERKPVLIKKYPNRRLYDTSTSSYIVLDDVIELVKADIPFIIQDKKSGEDITRIILSQIIFEQESKSSDFQFPLELQKQLIGMYGDKYATLVPDFLEKSMGVFLKEREKAKAVVDGAVERGTKTIVEMGQNIALRNIDIFKRSLEVMDQVSGLSPKPKGDARKEMQDIENEIQALQERLEKLKQT